MNRQFSGSAFRQANQAWSQFFSTPASPVPLAVLRLGLSAVLLLQALAISGNLLDLYGRHGVVQWSVMDGTISSAAPRIGWLADMLAPLGVSEASCIRGLFLSYVAGLAFLLLGWRTRCAAVLVFLTHLMMKNSAVASVYGVDTFAQIMLFYFIWMPVGQALSVDRLTGRARGTPSAEARLSLRVVQLHLALVYFATGVEKALGMDWWNGEAIWSSLMRRDLCPFDMAWMADLPQLAMLLGWGTLLLEIGYPFFMWPRTTRKLWGWSIVSLHVGIAIFLGLHSFAAVMCVLTFSVFLVPSQPQPVAETDRTKRADGRETIVQSPTTRVTRLTPANL